MWEASEEDNVTNLLVQLFTYIQIYCLKEAPSGKTPTETETDLQRSCTDVTAQRFVNHFGWEKGLTLKLLFAYFFCSFPNLEFLSLKRHFSALGNMYNKTISNKQQFWPKVFTTEVKCHD